MAFLTKIFGDANEQYIGRLHPLIEKINSLEAEFEVFSAEQLKGKTEELKKRLGEEQALDDVLPEAFALVREASKRTLGQRHFDVQLLGGIVLHQGKIAEMKTGEGKTLAATLPVYLNALEGKGVHVVTVNDYLAKRDAVWMGEIYYALGLTTGCIIHDNSFIYDPAYQQENSKTEDGKRDEMRDTVGGFKIVESYLRPVSRREAYAADITYGTNNEFGFDYLRDNMAYDLPQMAQRGFNFAIVDEVDSILIDEARTPLIISAPDMESSNWYREFARIIPNLRAETDYEIDEKIKAVTLTEQGIDKMEKILGAGNIYEERGIKYVHHLEQALRAQAMFKLDRDYVARNGEIIIVDEFTGRLMPGRRWSGGLHQAIEAKEGVEVKPESLTLASITFQNYFRMYKKLAGMTGTATTSAEEFDKVYKLDVAVIPTNKQMIRKDSTDRVYKSEEGKFKAVVAEIKEMHEKGQPVLVGTVSIAKNEYLGKLLEREGVPHNILNAKNHEKEGEIIAQAGRFGAVTIATNMAGRGVDIILGGNPSSLAEAAKVCDAGGLHVIGTERHEARRIDNQLRGRAGRQGDPGSSQFYVALEDDLLRIFGGDRVKKLMDTLKLPEDQPIESKLISGVIESAQAKIEGMNFDLRKHVLEYDEVMNKHRETIYRKRKEILEASPEELKNKTLEMARKTDYKDEDYTKKEEELGSDNMRKLERIVALRTLDMLWIDHLEDMEALRDSVRLRAYGQRDPLVEYKSEGHKVFQQLLQTLETTIVQNIMKASIAPRQAPPAAARQPQPRATEKHVGRNDPCPCGAKHPDGRPIKFKHCHGKT
ncbi:MAG: preprotein translocase subunit SecA [Candidatus Wildermuthbacteria bacterium RIFCSPHIGHO2_02_FULL_47_17]|uniref:Protein translocase subunit SecA n=1 Tax=Candidatus Wildermuthbacteria bacterium RIFCSPHIGHO2_02_FULL_47_17 TaxID=1802452 RepID=A0A1G2R3V0_9BACT|nr:MAG: preprotein translocase subunit SecA [Candidatus Wildermuthbacteria bacterium RIFCSPHIGHO2_02_FULL_47_17]